MPLVFVSFFCKYAKNMYKILLSEENFEFLRAIRTR